MEKIPISNVSFRVDCTITSKAKINVFWYFFFSFPSSELLRLKKFHKDVEFSLWWKQRCIVLSNCTFLRILEHFEMAKMIDWISTKFFIIAQDVIKLHSKNFNVSLGILKCAWRHIFYQKVFMSINASQTFYGLLEGRQRNFLKGATKYFQLAQFENWLLAYNISINTNF